VSAAAALSVAFFDPAHRLHGTARSGLTLLFRDAAPTALPEGASVERDGDRYRAVLEDRLDLRLEPVSPPADLGGLFVRVCRVEGTADGTRLDCLGTATETLEAPEWSELDALRGLSAIFDPENAVIALSRRPRGAGAHAEEDLRAFLFAGGELLAVEQPRLSTVYDGQGRQRTAGLEMWMPNEDFPRRASGTVVAGASLSLEGLRVEAAVFGWRMEGREGAGSYELVVREEQTAA
jgi:hypothetical protein